MWEILFISALIDLNEIYRGVCERVGRSISTHQSVYPQIALNESYLGICTGVGRSEPTSRFCLKWLDGQTPIPAILGQIGG